MCLSIPARIVTLEGTTATVDVAGNTREADVTMIDEPRVGDYVLLHAGFAIGRYDHEDALKTLALWRELAEAGLVENMANMPPAATEGDG